jgi:hypothetical protein
MKFAKFKYTDAKGKITNRRVLVVQEPSDKLQAFDVAELSEIEVAEFAEAYETAKQAFIAQIEVLKQEYDLKYNFRQFFANKIENLE